MSTKAAVSDMPIGRLVHLRMIFELVPYATMKERSIGRLRDRTYEGFSGLLLRHYHFSPTSVQN
jgi:hypothetical protein